MKRIFNREMSRDEIRKLEVSLCRKCTRAWTTRKNHLVSALVADHPRAGYNEEVHVLFALDQVNNRYIELDAWRMFRPEHRPGQTGAAHEKECDDAFHGQLLDNETRWIRLLRGRMQHLDVLCASEKHVIDMVGLFVVPVFDDSHVHPWPTNGWAGMMRSTKACNDTSHEAVVERVSRPIDGKHFTTRVVTVDGAVEVAVEIEAAVSAENVMHVVIGVQRGWSLAQRYGGGGTVAASGVTIVVDEDGANVVRADRLHLSMAALRSLSTSMNRTYIAVAILTAIHLRMAMAAEPIADLEALRVDGCERRFVAKVLAVAAGGDRLLGANREVA